jgi:hypothetical protein
MGSNPINLIIRFLLEIIALISVGMWGWKQSDSWLRFVFAIGIPILLAAIWGTFAVPDDPSRSGAAPIVTPGLICLAIELGFIAFATSSLYIIGSVKFGFALGIIVTLQHVGFLTESFGFYRISNLLISKRTLQTEITEANKFFVLPPQINLEILKKNIPIRRSNIVIKNKPSDLVLHVPLPTSNLSIWLKLSLLPVYISLIRTMVSLKILNPDGNSSK